MSSSAQWEYGITLLPPSSMYRVDVDAANVSRRTMVLAAAGRDIPAHGGATSTTVLTVIGKWMETEAYVIDHGPTATPAVTIYVVQDSGQEWTSLAQFTREVAPINRWLAGCEFQLG
ncbi:hypothetical protein NUU61_004532 [Penicillium alfredii]|uniref:Uncharacterized protein n=1 Tax=Penicillium alfredii TaxID=1506179 RepID=A0A9W9FLC8_9EURO|nr:uncharacterized protein NUU61_004532 [Penicillium alfredii]KAJ5102310.1 hypothetical protein NUU61_004532 [Penicillium alfredii]